MSYLILIICWIDRAFTTLIFLPMLYILYRKFRPTKPWTPRTMRLYLVCKVLVILFLVRIFCAGFIFTPVNYERFTNSGLFPLIKAIFTLTGRKMVKRAIWSGSGTSFGVHPMGICHLYPYTISKQYVENDKRMPYLCHTYEIEVNRL